MICTPDEAEKKWCPFIRVSLFSLDFPFNNRGQKKRVGADFDWHDLVNCIGPHCMAWRSTDGKSGYCGMAGKPTALSTRE